MTRFSAMEWGGGLARLAVLLSGTNQVPEAGGPMTRISTILVILAALCWGLSGGIGSMLMELSLIHI